MSTTVNIAELDLSGLPPTERILIAQALLDSVLFPAPSTELTPAEIADLHSRLDDIDSGRVVCEPWEDVRQRLWSRV